MQSAASQDFTLLGCLLVFILLQVFPLGGSFQIWRPDFVLLLTIYITQRRLTAFVVEFACVAGLLLDIVYGGVLGKHAIAFGLAIYLLRGLRIRLQHTSIYHEIVITFLLTVLSQVLLYSVNTLAQQSVAGSWILYPAFTTALFWPLVCQVLDRLITPGET